MSENKTTEPTVEATNTPTLISPKKPVGVTKVYLSKSWIYQGTTYGPGMTEFPDPKVQDVLKKAGAFNKDIDPENSAGIPEELKQLGLSLETIRLLVQSGIQGFDDLNALTDVALLSIPSVGPDTLAVIREKLKV